MRRRNSYSPPEACPLCNDATFEDKDWSGSKVRVYGCGMFFDCNTNVVSYQYLTADGARDVATEHFQRLLGDAHTFVGVHNVWT